MHHMLPPNLLKLPPPNLPTSDIKKNKCVIAQWIALLVVEDGGCSLTFEKVTNPSIIRVAAKSTCIYSPTELKQLYCRLGAKNRCSIKEAN